MAKITAFPSSDIVFPQKAGRKKAAAGGTAHGICQAFCSCAAYVERGSEALEARMRQRTLQTVRKVIKAHKINELELKTALAPA